jgi:Ca2+-binding EF-hand superfamily protein
MKIMLFAGAALAAIAATPVQAQPAEGDPGRFAQPETRAAVQARVQERFARADANRDGFVTQEEIRARAEARRGEWQKRRGERSEQRFEQLDTNHDGSISRAEFDSPRARPGGERRGQRFGHRGGGSGGTMGGFGGRAFAMMDSNRDGRVALAEAQSAALQRFDRVDSNRDGTISLEERQSAREAIRERRQERPAD